MKKKILFLCIIIFMGALFACQPEKSSRTEIFIATHSDGEAQNDDLSETPINLPILPEKIDQGGLLTDPPESERLLKILFIGNSFTFFNNLPGSVGQLLSAGGYNNMVGQVAYGGWSLTDHAESQNTRERIKNTDWDYVILQEKSSLLNSESMFSAIQELDHLIGSIGGKTILFVIWAYQDGLDSTEQLDYNTMQEKIIDNYQTIASELGIMVAPVGQTWKMVNNERPSIRLWNVDGIHPSKEGTYLASVVFYAVLVQESPEGLPYLSGLSKETANFIQQKAALVVDLSTGN